MKNDGLITPLFTLHRGKYGDGERVLKEGIAQNQKSFKLRFALSDLYLRTNRSDQTIALLKESLTLDKDADKAGSHRCEEPACQCPSPAKRD